MIENLNPLKKLNKKMCKWGTVTKVKFCKAKLKTRRMEGYVDSCIADIIQALNSAGIRTLGSCCGHGYMPGNIILEDNRVLVIYPSWKETYNKIYKKIKIDIHGHKMKKTLELN